jgi:hypothetical protein
MNVTTSTIASLVYMYSPFDLNFDISTASTGCSMALPPDSHFRYTLYTTVGSLFVVLKQTLIRVQKDILI